MDAPGKTDAAVLVPLFERDGGLTAVLTERRHDLRRHAGEISFPGGRQDEPDEDLRATALREAHEEIGLDPAGVELVGALAPVGTFVTELSRVPVRGRDRRRDAAGRRRRPRWRGCSSCRCTTWRDGFESKRLLRRGRADQDAHLHGRRALRLGRHRSDGRGPAGAAGADPVTCR